MFLFWRRRKRARQARSTRFADHQIIKLIYQGDKSTLYQARHTETGQIRVIKAYSPSFNRTARRMRKKYRLETEAEIGLALNAPEGTNPKRHPIVRTYGGAQEFGRTDGCHYIVLEYIDGFNLKNMASANDVRLVESRFAIARQICMGLKLIHEKDWIHRDFCSDNVLLYRSGVAKIIDLGFVCRAGMQFEEKSGTPSYMSPEQIRAEPLYPASDVYALGVVLYEMFTGRLPFESNIPQGNPATARRRASEIMDRHLHDPVEPPTRLAGDLSPKTEAFILRCLEKRANRRFQNVDSVLAELVAVERPN